MHHTIHLLPHHLSNQIAAGEVVQRPASIVKELLENAIDAQSTAIKVIIKGAGKIGIQVIDNGIGMSTQDAQMCFKKHATSKIKRVEDLSNIKTLGFRGEALAAIAAVAQVDMVTRPTHSTLGTRIVIQGAKINLPEPVVTTPGTHLKISNLFFNIPARRNFLKSDAIEFKHIIEEFQRVALANTHIAFTLYKANQIIYQLPIDKLSHRITHLFGEAYRAQLIPCQEETKLLTIRGYIGKPEYAKKTRGEQFFIVNQRFIKSAYLHNAVQRAFEGLLPPKFFPFYALFIDIAPDKIDVNVHPTKTEVKFENEHTLYAVLQAMIRKALAQYHITPSLDFEQNINLDPLNLYSSSDYSTENSLSDKTLSSTSIPDIDQPATLTPQTKDKIFYDHPSLPLTMKGKEDLRAQQPTTQEPELPFWRNATKVQWNQQYIFVMSATRILCIDQRAAHERILYEKYLNYIEKNTLGTSQQLLFPTQIRLNPAHISWLKAYQTSLQALGFIFSHLSTQHIVITGCPPEIINENLEALVHNLLAQGGESSPVLSLPHIKSLAQFFAQRGRFLQGKRLTREEIDQLVQRLFSCEMPTHTPKHQKIFVELTPEVIRDWWGKKH